MVLWCYSTSLCKAQVRVLLAPFTHQTDALWRVDQQRLGQSPSTQVSTELPPSRKPGCLVPPGSNTTTPVRTDRRDRKFPAVPSPLLTTPLRHCKPVCTQRWEPEGPERSRLRPGDTDSSRASAGASWSAWSAVELAPGARKPQCPRGEEDLSLGRSVSAQPRLFSHCVSYLPPSRQEVAPLWGLGVAVLDVLRPLEELPTRHLFFLLC